MGDRRPPHEPDGLILLIALSILAALFAASVVLWVGVGLR